MEVEIKTNVNFHNDEIEVIVRAEYTPGCPERGPTYSCGGQPAEPAEVSDVRVYFEHFTKENGSYKTEEKEITFLFNNSDLEDFESELMEAGKEEPANVWED